MSNDKAVEITIKVMTATISKAQSTALAEGYLAMTQLGERAMLKQDGTHTLLSVTSGKYLPRLEPALAKLIVAGGGAWEVESTASSHGVRIDGKPATERQREGLYMSVYDKRLGFSVRTVNCLKNDDLLLLGKVAQLSEIDCLRIPNMGRRSVNEVKDVLDQYELRFAMTIEGWP